jgi:hypothetical protein
MWWENIRTGKISNDNCDIRGIHKTTTTPDKKTDVASAVLDNRRQ